MDKFKNALISVYNFFLFPRFRYSRYFLVLQSFFKYSAREYMVKTAMEFVSFSKIPGNYFEFGVYKGETFSAAFHCAKKGDMKDMKFVAFDSFEGLPDLVGLDKNEYHKFDKGKYLCGLSDFKKNISKKGVCLSDTLFVQGWFDQTLNEYAQKIVGQTKASVIWVDCDLYESTVPVLNFITDYIQDGTILIFDDWFCFKGSKNFGEQKAFSEWLGKNPTVTVTEYHKFGWHGNSFIIHLA